MSAYTVTVAGNVTPPVVLRNNRMAAPYKDWHFTAEQAREIAKALLAAADYIQQPDFTRDIP